MQCYLKYKKKDGTIRNIYYDKIKFYNSKKLVDESNGEKYYKHLYPSDNDTHAILWDVESESWKTIILDNIIHYYPFGIERQNAVDDRDDRDDYIKTLDDNIEDNSIFIFKSIILGIIGSSIITILTNLYNYYSNYDIQRSHINFD